MDNYDSLKKWISLAKEMGYDQAKSCKISSLVPLQSMRDMCTPKACPSYGKNWGCAEAVGSLETCKERINSYQKAIILQTVGELEDQFDWEAIGETALLHKKRFLELSDAIRSEHPGALCLGAGGCDICNPCRYPKPCAHPDRAVDSMSAYGIFRHRSL